MLYTIAQGSRADYDALKHFHYCDDPSLPDQILVARLSPLAFPLAVLVVTRPTLNGPGRDRLFDGYFSTPDKHENAARVNRDLRTIARVIVHPSFRGCGIGKTLVAHYLANPLTKYTECLARMGHFCPVFERAGMKPRRTRRSLRDTVLSKALRAHRIKPESILHEPGAARALRHDGVRRALKRWLHLCRSTRATAPTAEALATAAMNLIARPMAYGHIAEHSLPGDFGDGSAPPDVASSSTPAAKPDAPDATVQSPCTLEQLVPPAQRTEGADRTDAAVITEAAKPASAPPPQREPIRHSAHARKTTSGRRRKAEPESAHFFKTPGTPDALHSFIKDELGFDIQRAAYIDGHRAPFDYLVHAFFEGRGSFAKRSEHPEAPTGNEPADPRDCVVWACRGGGKTFLGALATLLDLIFKPGIEIRIIGGSLDQSRHMFAHLKKFFQNENFASHLEGRIGRYGLSTRNGSHVEILAQSETAIRGTRIQKLRCDEVALFKPEVWAAAQLVTRTQVVRIDLGDEGKPDPVDLEVPGAIEAFSTMHEAGTVMDSVVNDAHGGTRTLFKWGIADVVEGASDTDRARLLRLEPGKQAPGEGDAESKITERGANDSSSCLPAALSTCPSPGHIPLRDALAMMARTGVEAWQSEMLCLRPSRSHVVYNDFDENVHVVDGAPWERAGVLRTVIGMDFGFRGETVTLWGVLDGEHRLYIAHEIARAERALRWHIDAIKTACAASSLPRPEWVGIDPAANQRNFHSAISTRDGLERAGFGIRDRSLSIEHGIDLVRARLAPAGQLCSADLPPGCTIPEPRLYVHRRCERLIECLKGYHYDQKDKRSGQPIKDGLDHACDALRYLVINLERSGVAAISRYA